LAQGYPGWKACHSDMGGWRSRSGTCLFSLRRGCLRSLTRVVAFSPSLSPSAKEPLPTCRMSRSSPLRPRMAPSPGPPVTMSRVERTMPSRSPRAASATTLPFLRLGPLSKPCPLHNLHRQTLRPLPIPTLLKPAAPAAALALAVVPLPRKPLPPQASP
jgi:hypothetical protein